MAVAELLWTAVYGLLLEWLSIKQVGIYHYGQFLVMIDGAPLCIALGWAVIITATMRFGDRIDLPDTARPILDALLALNIDLALDAIAIRLGLWSWRGVQPDAQWFGVPWVNLWAWFIVVWAYSGFLRALRPWQHYRSQRWLYAPIAMLISLLALFLMGELYRYTSATLGDLGGATLLLIIGSALIILNQRPRLLPARADPLAIIIPLAFHLFALVAALSAGIFVAQPLLAAVAAAMLIVCLAVHLIPHRRSAPGLPTR